MRKGVLYLFISIISVSVFAQKHADDLKYSKFFDSYYTNGKVRYSVEPGLSFIQGDLGEDKFSWSYGMGATYRVSAPIEIYAGAKYFRLHANDHNDIRNLSFCGNYYQSNFFLKYYLIYDRIRNNRDRRKPEKKVKFYVTSGLSLMYYNASPTRFGYFNSTRGYSISKLAAHFPIGFGFPIKVSKLLTVIPEMMFYYTTNDLLDGIVSYSELSDHYMLSSIKLEFTPIKKPKKPKKIKFVPKEEVSKVEESNNQIEE